MPIAEQSTSSTPRSKANSSDDHSDSDGGQGQGQQHPVRRLGLTAYERTAGMTTDLENHVAYDLAQADAMITLGVRKPLNRAREAPNDDGSDLTSVDEAADAVEGGDRGARWTPTRRVIRMVSSAGDVLRQPPGPATRRGTFNRRRSSLPSQLLEQLVERRQRAGRFGAKPEEEEEEEGGRRRKRRQSLAESQAQHAAIMATASYTGARSVARRMKVDPTSIDARAAREQRRGRDATERLQDERQTAEALMAVAEEERMLQEAERQRKLALAKAMHAKQAAIRKMEAERRKRKLEAVDESEEALRREAEQQQQLEEALAAFEAQQREAEKGKRAANRRLREHRKKLKKQRERVMNG